MDAVTWLAAIVLLILAFRRIRGQRWRGGVGSLYDWLNDEKRNAVEIIVEERAAAHDPEDRDGNLPDLAHPRNTRARKR